MNEADALRAANIATNNAYMVHLGFSIGSENKKESENELNERKTSKNPVNDNAGVESSSVIRRQSTRLQQRVVFGLEYKCDKCHIAKVFHSIRGLSMHQKMFCVSNPNYKPRWAFQLSDTEAQLMASHSNNNSQIDFLAPEPNQVQCIDQLMYEQENIDVDEDEGNFDNIDTDIDSLPNITTHIELDPITSFEKTQVELCKFLYGDQYIHCQTYEQMIMVIQKHFQQPKMSNKLNAQIAYNFSVEAGLSRKLGTKLLRVIKVFKPNLPVPKSIQGIELSVRKCVQRFHGCVKLNIPWIKKWKMHELKGFQPIKIYVRNVFEVISHILVDPEIMFVWKEHFRIRYHHATDRDNNHIYSDVMTSNWAKESEILVRDKDNEGYLMPLIFYTDGVQVSPNVHNKITPVVITLGNFSDTLLQKDISKRVIAYLPNFKSYSKDLIVSHIMTKLKICKTKVTSIY